MKVVIELKPEDADGMGGDILTDIDFTRSGNTFTKSVVADEDDEVLDSDQMVHPVVEMLADNGITPRRVKSVVPNTSNTTIDAKAALMSAVATLKEARRLLKR